MPRRDELQSLSVAASERGVRLGRVREGAEKGVPPSMTWAPPEGSLHQTQTAQGRSQGQVGITDR